MKTFERKPEIGEPNFITKVPVFTYNTQKFIWKHFFPPRYRMKFLAGGDNGDTRMLPQDHDETRLPQSRVRPTNFAVCLWKTHTGDDKKHSSHTATGLPDFS
jgi:hypothetical protein